MSSVLAVLPCSAGKYPVENMNGSVIYLESEKNRGKLKNKKKTSSAAKELLKNGILVETNKGLICMSLKDALNNGVGGHSLSVEDFQTVATELLFQEKPRKCNDHEGASVQVDNADVPVQIMKQMKTNFSNTIKDHQLFEENCISCEETSDNSEATSAVINKPENKPPKKRGGWPKGRKRKPELKYEIRPPKAPATGYVIFLNERRKDYRDMPFTEVTKLLGNEWSRLSLKDKKIYLDQAEIEKKRYREELRLYRQSDAYHMYLHKKRLKKLQGNATEESDMDATDEIDEEDNEELYCRSCDQWFHSFHNKKEHLYGRQHLQSIAGKCSKISDPDWCNANMSSTSLDESSLDGSSYLKGIKKHCCNKNKESLNMDDAIVRFMVANKEREEEKEILQKKLKESKAKNQSLSMDLQQLNETVGSLSCMAESEKTTQILLEQHLFNLLNVPTLFYLPEPLSEENN